MKSILIIGLILFSLVSLGQTNSIVTENYLRLNFTPKSGITPGTDNIVALDCDQITTRYNVSISGVSSTGNRCPSQNQLTASGGTIPVLTTSAITVNYCTSITAGGNISSQGGSAVTDRGVTWATTLGGLGTNKTHDGTGIGSFTSTITGLTPGATYYYCAYATNSYGTATGTAYMFTVNAYDPSITTASSAPTGVSSTGFTLYADPIDIGCAGSLVAPSIMFSTTSDFASYTVQDSPTPASLNAFSVTFQEPSPLFVILPSTTYYYRARIQVTPAYNGSSNFYGATHTVTTLP